MPTALMFLVFVAFSNLTMASDKKPVLSKGEIKTQCGVVKGMREAGDYTDAIIFEDGELETSSSQWMPFLAASMAGQFRICIDTVLFQGRKVIVKIVRD